MDIVSMNTQILPECPGVLIMYEPGCKPFYWVIEDEAYNHIEAWHAYEVFCGLRAAPSLPHSQ